MEPRSSFSNWVVKRIYGKDSRTVASRKNSKVPGQYCRQSLSFLVEVGGFPNCLSLPLHPLLLTEEVASVSLPIVTNNLLTWSTIKHTSPTKNHSVFCSFCLLLWLVSYTAVPVYDRGVLLAQWQGYIPLQQFSFWWKSAKGARSVEGTGFVWHNSRFFSPAIILATWQMHWQKLVG